MTSRQSIESRFAPVSGLTRLIYVSHAIGEVRKSDLVDILDASFERNRRAGITGILLYSKHRFVQLLEGERESVTALYARIGADARHRDLRLVSYGNTPRRHFNDWSMALYRVDGEELDATIERFLDLDEAAAQPDQFIHDARFRSLLSSSPPPLRF